LKKGVDVNRKIVKDVTMLHCAALLGKPAIAKLLLEKGADFNASVTGKSNGTPLAAARDMGHKEVEALLKQHGAKE
jgi:ankyrin repeat protein